MKSLLLLMCVYSKIRMQDVIFKSNITKIQNDYFASMTCASNFNPISVILIVNNFQNTLGYSHNSCFNGRNECDETCKCNATAYYLNFTFYNKVLNNLTCIMRFNIQNGIGHIEIYTERYYQDTVFLKTKRYFKEHGTPNDTGQITTTQTNEIDKGGSHGLVYWIVAGLVLLVVFILVCGTIYFCKVYRAKKIKKNGSLTSNNPDEIDKLIPEPQEKMVKSQVHEASNTVDDDTNTNVDKEVEGFQINEQQPSMDPHAITPDYDRDYISRVQPTDENDLSKYAVEEICLEMKDNDTTYGPLKVVIEATPFTKDREKIEHHHNQAINNQGKMFSKQNGSSDEKCTSDEKELLMARREEVDETTHSSIDRKQIEHNHNQAMNNQGKMFSKQNGSSDEKLASDEKELLMARREEGDETTHSTATGQEDADIFHLRSNKSSAVSEIKELSCEKTYYDEKDVDVVSHSSPTDILLQNKNASRLLESS